MFKNCNKIQLTKNKMYLNNRWDSAHHYYIVVVFYFHPIKITTTWNALRNEVVTSRTVNSFKNSLDKHWAENMDPTVCPTTTTTNNNNNSFWNEDACAKGSTL